MHVHVFMLCNKFERKLNFLQVFKAAKNLSHVPELHGILSKMIWRKLLILLHHLIHIHNLCYEPE